MPWRCTAREHLDDDHATAAAWTSRLAVIGGGTGGLAFGFCNGEQLTRAGDVVGAGVLGEQAIVADAYAAKDHRNWRLGTPEGGLCIGVYQIEKAADIFALRPPGKN
jgi:hypothetical protein